MRYWVNTIRSEKLRWFNHLLSLIICGLAIYIIIWPFWPDIVWRLQHRGQQISPSQLLKTVQSNDNSSVNSDSDQHNQTLGNRLYIPRIDADLMINEGSDISVLRKGIWRRPKSSAPDSGGNTVIVGHRFRYSAKSEFYHLDKVQLDDPIVIYWNNKQINYKVSEIFVVPASQTTIEDQTNDKRLTLYTCTPIWNLKDRLVIIAKPLEDS